MAVLYTPHFMQFFDDNGEPLSGGLLYTYAAGTTTPKATFTTEAGNISNPNPIVLDAAGRAVIFIEGAYKFRLETSAGVLVRETDNISSFETAAAATGAINWASADTLPSAATVNIGAATSNYVIITGTTTITAFDSIAQGAERLIRFNGSLQITHNATSMILPGGASITTQAGDIARFISEGSGNWRLTQYQPANLELTTASAATVNLGALNAPLINITGTTTITSFGTVAAGTMRRVVFAGALTLTHNATSLILPANANITTAAGDSLVAVSLGSGNWRVVDYQRQSGGGILGNINVATTSGTSVDLSTAIPAGVRRITIALRDVSLSGTAAIAARVGSGSFATSGYVSAASTIASTVATGSSTDRFLLSNTVQAANYAYSGLVTITRLSGNIWVLSGVLSNSNGVAITATAGGNISLGGELDRLQFISSNGTDTFDAGSATIFWEF
jgi:hypothetical protein